ncbi:hypothetical protein FHS96_005168 [Sphingomonas zeicaulis]
MSSILYGLWTAAIVGLFLLASIFGYSPFADGGRAAPVVGVYGPSHK